MIKKLWSSFVLSTNPFCKIIVRSVRLLIAIKRGCAANFCIILFFLFRLIPLQDKIVLTTFRGAKYGDNPKFILEELFALNPNITYIWLANQKYQYDVPKYVKKIPFYNYIKKTYELATAKVWVNTHRMEHHLRRRKGQLIIETWHGGLGLKKIEGDVPKVLATPWEYKEIVNTSKISDLFISNSDHLSKIYRRAFNFKGKIWKSGYPKNDILLAKSGEIREKVSERLNIPIHSKIVIYAPTFRDSFLKSGFNKEVYDIDFRILKKTFEKKFGGTWYVLLRWHPIMAHYIKDVSNDTSFDVVNASDYPDMQELILSADAFISDYSSCIFDAALREIPCFTFATDFEEYKADRGVYYEMDELPFPYARNNEELEQNILKFDGKKYLDSWIRFKERTGFYESGHAGKDIAHVINEFIKGNLKPLEDIHGEP